jgi:hypothetical protein
VARAVTVFGVLMVVDAVLLVVAFGYACATDLL